MILQHLVALKIAFEKADVDKSGGLDMEEVDFHFTLFNFIYLFI